MGRHRSSALPLAWLYVVLIGYASLYPFTGWRWPTVTPWAFLMLPWPRYWTGFDLVSNLLGYLPLGLLVFAAQVRTGRADGAAFLRAVLAAAALSLAMELVQNGLPSRVPSNVDWAFNTLGAAAGAALGMLMHAVGLLDRWQRLRERWFVDHSAGALALLLLWPTGLLFPTALPFGVGQVLSRLQDTLAGWLTGTPLEEWSQTVLEAQWFGPGLPPAGEFCAIALGLIAPCLLAFTVCRPGWRRGVLVLGIGGAGVAATTLSTALNFGPDHAMAWLTSTAMAGLSAGGSASLLLAWVPRRAAVALGLMALTALVSLVAQAPEDVYFAQSLQAWEQGRFIRFHGAAQWVGWLWPYAAMTYLLGRVASREDA
ncbi:MAG: VanZ family protein [Pseudomonadota bacterium]|nr:VanZ family protein [Pseudomonadota bacterium]